MQMVFNSLPLVGVFGLACGLFLYTSIGRLPSGNARMVEIADSIREGAMVFLRLEYAILSGFIAIVFILLASFLDLADPSTQNYSTI